MNTKLRLFVTAVILLLAASNTILYLENVRRQQIINQLQQELSAKYGVATYIAYLGSWTILHVQDKNRVNPHVDFYLAYNIHTHETLSSPDYPTLVKELLSRE